VPTKPGPTRPPVEYIADDSVHLQDWPVAPANWTSPDVEADIRRAPQVRALVNESIEPHRAAGKLGKSLDAAITLTAAADSAEFRALEKHRDFLPELFIVSHVSLTPPPVRHRLRPSVCRTRLRPLPALLALGAESCSHPARRSPLRRSP
jgi:hypothetical protein